VVRHGRLRQVERLVEVAHAGLAVLVGGDQRQQPQPGGAALFDDEAAQGGGCCAAPAAPELITLGRPTA
jgi:hypothetical protein